jgi:hypothetical protein
MTWVIQICDPSRPNSWFMDVRFIAEIACAEWEEAQQNDKLEGRTLNIELTTEFWKLVLAGSHPNRTRQPSSSKCRPSLLCRWPQHELVGQTDSRAME